MKLFYSPTSPFVRKVMICAITRGLDAQITRVSTNPHVSPPDLLAANPLSKVPCLITDDGLALFDSPVICEYLDSVGDEPALFPRTHHGERLMALKLQALGDGMMDAAVLRRGEMARPEEAARNAVMARQKQAVDHSLALLEQEIPHSSLDIGTITIVCALGYLDFRYEHEAWREKCPKLAAWFAKISEIPAVAQTVPK
jgi:glutathione S-transferase